MKDDVQYRDNREHAVTVPTDDERNGVFSGSFDGTIQDPFVAQVLQGRPGCESAINAAGGSIPDPNDPGNYGDNPIPWSTLFPTELSGNTNIPVACQDPVAVDLMNKYVPHASPSTGLFQAVLSARDRQDQLTVRFDHRINDKQNFSAYYYFTDENLLNPFNISRPPAQMCPVSEPASGSVSSNTT